MPSTFRIPKADHHRSVRRRSCPRTPGGPTARSPTTPTSTGTTARCSRRCSSFEQKVAKWDRLDENLKSYAQLASAGVIGCSLVPRLRLLHGPQRRARPRQGARGAALARVRRLHRARARGAGVRRGDEHHAARRDRRDGGRPDRAARRRGRRRADPDGGAGEHALAVQLRRRAAEPGLLRRLRAAARRTLGERERRPTPSSSTATCCSRSPTRCSARPPTPRTCCRRPGCAGRRSTGTEVRDARAYLVRITTRLSLNRMRTLARRRESYVGPWLPEPLLTSPDVAEDVELADSVSTAMLLVLETLTPTERAVFVLREVFDLPYDEIAAAVDKSPAAVRQIAHRAREPRRGAPSAGRRHRRRAGRGDRPVPRGGGDRRPAEPDGRAGSGRRAAHRRRWRQEGRAASDPRPGEGGPVPRRGRAGGRRRPTWWSSTGPLRCGCSSTARSTASPPCWSRTAWSPASTSCATRRSCARLDEVTALTR